MVGANASLARVSRKGVRRTVMAVGSRADRRVPRLCARLVRGLTVFVFHDITPSPSPFQRIGESYTRPEVFRDQILWIGDRFRLVAPTDLEQLGGTGDLPRNAALITFDDAWAGVFRAGLPILESLRVPSLCFLNTATVAGDPDLSAVRRYERTARPLGGPLLRGHVDRDSAAAVLGAIRTRYGADERFLAFQGQTATDEDLRGAAGPGLTWFGSHLHHHWDMGSISPELYRQSLTDNLAALARYPNVLPAFATPYGYAGERGRRALTLTPPRDFGQRVVFIATGRQNAGAGDYVLDRLQLAPEGSGPREWWYEAHRRRLLGSLAG